MAGIAEFWYVVKINFFFLKITMRLCVFLDFEFLWMPSKKCPDWEIQKINIMPTWKRKKWGKIYWTGIWFLCFFMATQKFWRSFYEKSPEVRYDFKNWKTATLELQGLSYHKLIDLMTSQFQFSLQTFDQDEKFDNF